mmetsp:Transcript_3579/g.5018  ORF Transcript_3579/g.5018 Transcript_3579/m.5018 type:complete len:224 (-) Transcript_3579:1285-1956(-)|eukprot:CAMPEP_0197302552 /NCGR_PEP_ID=MMETSP0890-20130614/51121_1 /TAXON_ID=44058 ORGANISM="Aureoumbra lagunensis, Strain CCMP1510" /NCGR_SAMPLE_ID=MMETSP0890 /ASSEMBLY_ACC=CAM_ASM_000533 /LENGTH=223 /DNA_ID=CAMNT_0042782183 /DNA_START=59 /DNA_END=730 /DNA_ORIENTATION=+
MSAEQVSVVDAYPLGAFQCMVDSAKEESTNEDEQLEDAILPYLAFAWIVDLFAGAKVVKSDYRILMPDYSSYPLAPFLAFGALLEHNETNFEDDFPLLPDEDDVFLSLIRTVIHFPFQLVKTIIDGSSDEREDDDLLPNENDPILSFVRKCLFFPFEAITLVLTPFIPSRTPPNLKKIPSADQFNGRTSSQDNLQDAASIAGNRLFSGAFGRANKSVRLRNTL